MLIRILGPLLLVQASVTTAALNSNILPAIDTMGLGAGGGGVAEFLAMTREERFAAHTREFQETVNNIRNTTIIQSGANLGSRTVEQARNILGTQASKGVMVTVENLSNRILGEPQFYIRCGYSDPNLGAEQSIRMGFKDVFLLHNRKKSLTSSCGSLSWQIMDGAGRPHTLPGGQGLRMYLTWSSLDSVRGNKCETGKRNEFVIGFETIDLDHTGHGTVSWRHKRVYKTYHKDDVIAATTRQTQGNTLSSLIESPDGELEVRAVMGPDCLSTLNIEILGKFQAEMPTLREDLDIYTKDEIWEQMIRQSWLDIVRTINRDHALYGIGLSPLELDPLMPEPIVIDQEMVGYQVNLAMWNVSIVGIEDIALKRLSILRGQGLNNLREEALLDLGDLEVRGMYQYTAQCTAWLCVISEFDSEGPQPFSIRMTNATFSVNVNMDTTHSCNQTNGLVLSDIQLPLEYSDVTFDFTNIGTVLGAAVSVIGGFALDFGKGVIVDVAKQAISSEVSSMICEEIPMNITLMDKMTPTFISTSGPWHDLLQGAHRGWGMDSLRRDIMAEKLVMKVWREGLAKHFANESSPLVQALDPFRLLPASEDVHETGVFKAHIVACELFLTGLRNLTVRDIQLVRNSDLTYSALRLSVFLPSASLSGKFRLNHVHVLSIFDAKDSLGTVAAELTGIEVVLTVVMNTTAAVDQSSDSKIQIPHFEVEFHHQNAALDVQGIGGKIISQIANKGIKKVGDKILHMQREAISTEIKNIFWGLAKCLMYNPGQGFATCMDNFWMCLGFEIPFEFPGCPAMYAAADAEIARFPSYRAYLRDYHERAAVKAAMVEQNACLARS